MDSRLPAGAYRLVIGMNPMMPAVLDELTPAGVPVVLAADVDPAGIPHGIHLVRGDPTQPATMRAARPEGAQQALLAGTSDGDVLVSAVILRKLAPQLPVTALVSSASVREALRELGVQQAVSAQALISRTLAVSLETRHAGDMVSQLVSPNAHRLAEVPAADSAVGRHLSAVRDAHPGLVLGIIHNGAFDLGIGDDPVVAAGDALLVAQPSGTNTRGFPA